jgi:beta-phosphoglucomutase-like phosphatase (HAD superfamily)
MSFLGIIFDFNGVLWWDGHLQEQAWGEFSKEKRGVPFTGEEMAIHVHGRNNRHTLAYLAGRPMAEAELEQLIQHKEAIYRRLCLEQGQAFRLSPGAVELLDFLVEHRVPHTIATASGKTNLDFFVRHLELGRWFDLEQIVYDDGSRPGKPAPDIYLQAARYLGLDPARCVVVEDSRSGIQAARAAGIGHIIALGPRATHPALAQLGGVDGVAEDLGQLPRQRLFLD